MSGVFSAKAMIQSIANNRALLKKGRLKNHPYLNADTGKRKGVADYQELKLWRLECHEQRTSARRWVAISAFAFIAIFAAIMWMNAGAL